MKALDELLSPLPGDGVIGEELQESKGTTGRRWVIE